MSFYFNSYNKLVNLSDQFICERKSAKLSEVVEIWENSQLNMVGIILILFQMGGKCRICVARGPGVGTRPIYILSALPNVIMILTYLHM